MNSYGKKRDACEKEIVKALEKAGASVSKLDGTGIPDLLVGYRGRTYLMECKDPKDGKRNSRSGVRGEPNPLGLRDSQWDWWQAWRGARAIIVTTPSEALAALAEPHLVADGVFLSGATLAAGPSAESPLEQAVRDFSEAHTIRGRSPK
jgi:hypothetical protein